MARLLKILLALSLLPLSIAWGQTTTITATVVDSDGTVWANAPYTLSFRVNPSQPNQNVYNIGGVPLNPALLQYSGYTDGSGVLSQAVYQNTAISPSGSQWTLQICPLSSAGTCGATNFSASGSTMNVSTTINAAITAPRFPALAGAYGYTDLEAQATLPTGATYWNVITETQRYWNGSIWVTGAMNLPYSIMMQAGQTLAQAATALIAKSPNGGIINVPPGQFTSGANSYSTCISGNNISVIGIAPVVSSDGSHLVGGSVILGGVYWCGTNHTMYNIGVDVGPNYISGGGTLTDGIVGSPATYTSATPLQSGDTLSKVIVLGPSGANVHAVRTEHETGVTWNNLTVVNPGSHGIVIKSPNTSLVGFSSSGCVTDCVNVQSDGNTPLVNNVLIANGQISSSSGAEGIVIGTEGASVTSYVTVDNVPITIGGTGYNTGVLINNDAGGNGAVNHITISNSPVTVSGGAHPCFLSASTGGYSADTITLNNDSCFNPTIQGSVAAMNFATNPITNLSITNFNTQCQTYGAQLEGTGTVNGWIDACSTGYSQPTIEAALSTTSFNIQGLISNRGNVIIQANGGSVLNNMPGPSMLNTDGYSLTKQVSSTGNVIDTFYNSGTTGASSEAIVAKTATSLFATNETYTPSSWWKAGQAAGDGNYQIGPIISSTFHAIVAIDKSAPVGSFGLLSTGQPSFGFFNTGLTGCLQSSGGGVVSNTGTPCGTATTATNQSGGTVQVGANGTVQNIRQYVTMSASPLCTTGAAAFSGCHFTVTWPKAFPNTNYAWNCYPDGIGAVGWIVGDNGVAVGSVIVNFINATAVATTVNKVFCEGWE